MNSVTLKASDGCLQVGRTRRARVVVPTGTSVNLPGLRGCPASGSDAGPGYQEAVPGLLPDVSPVTRSAEAEEEPKLRASDRGNAEGIG